MTDEQTALIRQSLVNSVFAKYKELRGIITTLPYDQANPGLLRGAGYLDDAILWIKEVVMAAPLILQSQVITPPPAPASEPCNDSTATATQDHCIEEKQEAVPAQ